MIIRKVIANSFFTLKHRGFRAISSELNKTEYYNESQIKNYQNIKLQLLINHAYRNVPFYKELFDKNGIKPEDIKTVEDLKKIPILEKSDIQNNYYNLSANNVPKVYNRTTTGSTGMPLKLLYDKKSKLIEIALMERFSAGIGKAIGSRQIILWGRVNNSRKVRFKQFVQKIFYNIETINVYKLDDKGYSDIAGELSKCPNIHLRGYTNSIYMLACKLSDSKTTVNIDAVSVTAEKLHKFQRDLIEKHLTKNLYDQYGCGETNSLAFECNHHKGLHHAFEHSILEIANDDGSIANKEGAALITNLDNFAMPLIRYRNGDIIKLSDQACTCGRSGLLIESIQGRLYDFIEGTNGVNVHSAFLDHVLDDSGLFSKFKVRELRIIQTRKNELVVQYVSDSKIPLKNFSFFENTIIEQLGKMNFLYVKKVSISNTLTGKHRFVVPLAEFEKNPSIYDI